MGKINDAPQKSKKEKARKERKKKARKSKEVRKKERKKGKEAQSFGGTTDAVAEGLGLLGATA